MRKSRKMSAPPLGLFHSGVDNTTRGAKSSAVIFSIIETAKENGLEPYHYLTYILKTAPNLDLAAHPERISLLLPQAAPDECKPVASLV